MEYLIDLVTQKNEHSQSQISYSEIFSDCLNYKYHLRKFSLNSPGNVQAHIRTLL